MLKEPGAKKKKNVVSANPALAHCVSLGKSLDLSGLWFLYILSCALRGWGKKERVVA